MSTTDHYGADKEVGFRSSNDLHHRKGSVKVAGALGGDRRVSLGGDDLSADHLLESMGYQAEFVRSRSTWQVAFMSFVLASIPYGLSTTFYYPLVGGGATNIIWGWVGVSFLIICVAISLGEITSVYPTAGGVYYQTFMLSPVWCRRIMSWICGWSYVVGNITITLAVNFGTTLFLIACINIFSDADGNPIFNAETYQVFLIFVGVTVLCNLISSLGNKWLPILDTFAIFWTFAGVIAIVITILVLARGGRNSAEYVFTDFEPSSGWPDGWSFCVGLLQAAYATSSTGMIISMCEEVRDPARQVPKAMVGTIVLNFICGLLFLIPIVFVIQDIPDLVALASGQPIPTIFLVAVGNEGGAFALTIPILVLSIICGVGCTTATSRCTWAFARDGAIPGSRWWKKVDARTGIPLNALLLTMVIEILLGVIYFGSSAAFNAFSGVGVICLTVAYAVPIAVSLLGGRKHLHKGKYDLGIFGLICNVIALAWSLLAVPLFCMPSYIPIDPSTMNYASAVFVLFFIVAAGWYFIWGKKNYQGPPTHEEHAEF